MMLLLVALMTVLPDHIGEYQRISIGGVGGDLDLLREYGLQESSRGVYRNATGRNVSAEVYRFDNADGGYAAYLCLAPTGSVRLRQEYGEGAVAGGVTVVGYDNYVLRFQGAAPPEEEMRKILVNLPQLGSSGRSKNSLSDDARVPFSERVISGPVGLKRFAPRLGPAVVAFHTGATGWVARFEMPSGPVTRIVLEYPSPRIAQERYEVLSKVTKAQGKVADRRIGLVFDARDENDAAPLLTNYALGVRDTNEIGWDPYSDFGAPLSVEGAVASIFWVGVFGGFIGCLRFLSTRHRGYPDHAVLHI
jgi:hypothetical protein